MGLKEALSSGKFAVSCEFGPVKGTDTHEIKENIEILKPKVDAANVTDQQSSVMRLSGLVTAALCVQGGLEPIFQMTCRDRNRIALQSDLLGAWVMGIKNVLALTGDLPSLGDQPAAKPVFDRRETSSGSGTDAALASAALPAGGLRPQIEGASDSTSVASTSGTRISRLCAMPAKSASRRSWFFM